MKISIILLILLVASVEVMAKSNVVRLEGIQIKADNDAPHVMYIIPWQNPEGAERLYSPVTGADVDRLKPLDPYTFELELELHEQWINSTDNAVDLVLE